MDLHPLRDQVLGEVHARPFLPIPTPTRLLHYAFMTDAAAAAADRRALGALCASQGKPGPSAEAKHCTLRLPEGWLRWEQHSEYTAYTWELAGGGDGVPFMPPPTGLGAPADRPAPPGPLLAAVDLHLVPAAWVADPAALFDPASLALSLVDDGAALVATDFRVGANGFVRILVADRSLTPAQAGALTQRLLEIETYRLLALLGLPMAQRLAPSVKAIEDGLTRIAQATTETDGIAADAELLHELTALAARAEADAAASSYRFGASRAYDGIVQQRLAAIGERSQSGHPTIAAFLSRRLAPAMRTCATVEERQANLSRKLTRAANLLRTRVDVGIEQQNRDLLTAMNQRAHMQLRLQQTVEGLSVAAISYYVIGLIGHVLEGLHDGGLGLDPALWSALAVPVVVLLVWRVVHRIRRRHGAGLVSD